MDEPTAPNTSMPVHDEHGPAGRYRDFLAHMPQVRVELVVETTAGVLLADRTSHSMV